MTHNIDLQQVPTPCYVMDQAQLRRNAELLKSVQDQSGAQIILALKGFAMFSTFGMLSQYLKGTTASSLHEARLGHETFAGHVHAYSPAYVPQEFAELLQYSTHVTFNSLTEWQRYAPQVQATGGKVGAGLRINPEYSEVEIPLYDPCIRGSRLGVTAAQLNGQLPAGIEGLHSHTLCENNAETLARTVQAIEQKFGPLLHQIKWLNLGGGHSITRKGYNVELLVNTLKHLRETYNLEVILEPGSAVAWEAGYLVSTVLDIVENEGVQTAMLDTSFAAHMPDTIEMPYTPQVIGSTDKGPYAYKLGGLTCLAGDFKEGYHFEKPLEVGQKLVFWDMGHYTMVKNHTFNGVRLPDIGLWTEQGQFELVRRFGYDDYKMRLS